MKNDNTELFERMPIPKALAALVVPAIISQMITVIYNMADTFFIGQTGDPVQVAAAMIATPPFIMLGGFAGLFGIGGASLLSRSLGMGNRKKAGQVASFSIWGAILVSLLYGLLVYVFRRPLFMSMGADSDTYGYCIDYIRWTMLFGSVPTVLSMCLAHLVRSEGYSKQASFGIAMGGILNMILDPIFIFPLKMGVEGAAVATLLSNIISVIYFILLLHKNRETTVIKFNPQNLSFKDGIPKDVLLLGLPNFGMMLMGTVSNLVLTKVVSAYSNVAIAGMGIAKKIDTLAFAISNGMTQGVLPLIAYNHAAKNFDRMRAAVKTAFTLNIASGIVGTAILFLGAVPIMKFFINDAETVAYGQHFLQVICLPCTAFGVTLMIITTFQAMGEKVRPMILSLLRKGCLDIPLMFITDGIAGSMGIPWATTIAEILACLIALSLFIPFWRKIKKSYEVTL